MAQPIDQQSLPSARVDRSAVTIARAAVYTLLSVSLLVLIEKQAIWTHHISKGLINDQEELVAKWELLCWGVGNATTLQSIDMEKLTDKSTEAYLVDQSGWAVTPMRKWTEDTRAALPVGNRAVVASVTGSYGVGVTTGYAGDTVLAVYGPVTIDGQVYALILESELYQSSLFKSPWWYHVSEIVAVGCGGLSVALLLLLETTFSKRNVRTLRAIASAISESPITQNKEHDRAIASAINRTNVAVAVFSTDGQIVWASSPTECLLGKTLAEIEGTSIYDWLDTRLHRVVARDVAKLAFSPWCAKRVKLGIVAAPGKQAQELALNVHRLVFNGRTYGAAALTIPFADTYGSSEWKCKRSVS